MTAIQWLVLTNVKHNWHYKTSICDKDAADKAYLWAVNNGYIKDGKITDAGKMILLVDRKIEKSIE